MNENLNFQQRKEIKRKEYFDFLEKLKKQILLLSNMNEDEFVKDFIKIIKCIPCDFINKNYISTIDSVEEYELGKIYQNIPMHLVYQGNLSYSDREPVFKRRFRNEIFRNIVEKYHLDTIFDEYKFSNLDKLIYIHMEYYLAGITNKIFDYYCYRNTWEELELYCISHNKKTINKDIFNFCMKHSVELTYKKYFTYLNDSIESLLELKTLDDFINYTAKQIVDFSKENYMYCFISQLYDFQF